MSSSGLLSGVRVLDLSVWRPGPYATQLLAELGAEVLKVEPPGGDPMRSYPELFASLHANKRSIMLDLKTDQDRRRALELATAADVLVEGFRPGVVDRLGLGYEDVRDVNRAIVYCSVSGMGQDGSLALVPGHDLNYQAWAGSLAPDGGPPVVPAVPIADLAGGMAAAMGICAALVRRLSTGEGERLDVAMADVLATWTGAVQPRAEGTDPSSRGVPGYGVFATADGTYLALGVLTEDHFWSPLCTVLGLADCAELGFVERMARTSAAGRGLNSSSTCRPLTCPWHPCSIAPACSRSPISRSDRSYRPTPGPTRPSVTRSGSATIRPVARRRHRHSTSTVGAASNR
jgi:crotonobetainyl-CoA:carnitine CoA-transferase CaiB-like acyl-CoA transferase